MASGIRNPNVTYPYHDETWPDDSFWTFRREQTGDDRDAVTAMTTKTIISRIDRKKVKALMKEGGSLEDYISEHTDTQTVMSTEKAMLAVMGVKVEGELFTIPADFTDENDKPHPLAGKLIPQPPRRSLRLSDPKQYQADLDEHLKWLGLLDPDDRSNALEFMTSVWAGRSPEDMKRFQGSGVGVDKPTRRTGSTG